MKYRQTTKEETEALINAVTTRYDKVAKVGLIGFYMLRSLYEQYVNNFKPSLFRLKPMKESAFYYSYTNGCNVRTMENDQFKYVYGSFWYFDPIIKYKNPKYKVECDVNFIIAINRCSSVQYTASEREKWISRALCWGERPFEFTSDTDLDHYEDIMEHDKWMDEIIATYGHFGEEK